MLALSSLAYGFASVGTTCDIGAEVFSPSVCVTCAAVDGSVGSCPTTEFPTESNTKAEMLVKCQKHCKDEPQYGGLGLGSVAQTDDYYIGFQYQRPGITKCR